VIRVLLPSPTEAEDGLQDRFGRLDRRVVEDVDWPAFRSVTAEGLPISSESLRGRIWIADFLALECSSCPGTTLRIADLQERTAASNVLFVSFAMEAGAEPAALQRYQRKFRRSDPRSWSIVVADDVYLPRMLVACGLARTEEHARLGACSMRPRLYLVDRRGRLRGTYDSTNPTQVEWLAIDADAIAKEGTDPDGPAMHSQGPPR
jgi:protein SCO1/2